MTDQTTDKKDEKQSIDYKTFFTGRLIVGIIAVLVGLWLISVIIGFFKGPSDGIEELHVDLETSDDISRTDSKLSIQQTMPENINTKNRKIEDPNLANLPKQSPNVIKPQTQTKETTVVQESKTIAPVPLAPATKQVQQPQRSLGTRVQSDTIPQQERIAGVKFVDAIIKPISYELNERFWGWRPNDILNFTDNVNNFQLGVLEATRRTVVVLTDHISRTGSAAVINPHLENAMNGFMVSADKYWFPSPESKYRDGIEELEAYREQLKRRETAFYTRLDNLVPLLLSYQHLLGSCDENLIKKYDDQGNPISSFQADDYFYYAQGVASSLVVFLKAVEQEFEIKLSSPEMREILHHAIESCELAEEIDPLIVIESDLSSIFANHRSNMAGHISHARFYIELLIKALTM